MSFSCTFLYFEYLKNSDGTESFYKAKNLLSPMNNHSIKIHWNSDRHLQYFLNLKMMVLWANSKMKKRKQMPTAMKVAPFYPYPWRSKPMCIIHCFETYMKRFCLEKGDINFKKNYFIFQTCFRDVAWTRPNVIWKIEHFEKIKKWYPKESAKIYFICKMQEILYSWIQFESIISYY